jgi:hypothetical protein
MGHANETNRYDYAIIFIKEFFGKSLVVSLQSGISTVMCDYSHKNVPPLPCFLPAVATKSFAVNAFTDRKTLRILK